MRRTMLAIAKEALGTIKTLPPAEAVPNPRFFIVTDELKHEPTIDAADIVAAMQHAAKENTAMTEPETGITDKFRASLTAHREQIEGEIERINSEQATADQLHRNNLASLNEAIKTAETIHRELTAGNDARIADANTTLDGIKQALNATAPKGVAAAPPQPPTSEEERRPDGTRGKIKVVPLTKADVVLAEGGDK